jgi:protein-S-isoprenylcysteine O-methyltransferase Ste14
MSSENHKNVQWIGRRSVVLTLLGLPVYFALFMFLPAGTWAWTRGWLFILVFVGTLIPIGFWLWRVNPEVVIARSNPHKGTKRWDKVLVWFLYALMTAIVTLAALDDGRFHWLPVLWWVSGLGYLLLVIGLVISAWAESVNKFFEVTVRLQTDRGQTVIQTGPYAIMRHPGYSSGLLIFVGTALALGSLWALIPAVVSWLLLVLRTKWEDDTLQAELPGYKEYTQKVRYRLLPGIW